jgi:cell wall-associated NlpC family hydrolase
VLASLAATGLVAAGGGAQGAPDAAARTVVEAVRQELGDGYQWGGNGPGSWDCSGLVSGMWRKAGVTSMPRVSRDQQRWAWPITAADARPGDLVFFGDPVTHVAIYIGAGRIIDASSSRKQVVERAIWSSDVVRYGRVPRPGVAHPPPPAASKPAPAASEGPKPTTKPAGKPSAKPAPTSAARPTAKPAPTPAPKPTSSPAAQSAQPLPHRPIPASGHRARTSPWADQLVAAATRALGSGWREKGTGPAYDSAGLVRRAVWSVSHRTLPDTAAGIEGVTTPVALADLRVGDLIFWGRPAVHVAIYVGNGEMIDASKVLRKVSRRRVFSSETVRFARLR